jgi:hypothetical protein
VRESSRYEKPTARRKEVLEFKRLRTGVAAVAPPRQVSGRVRAVPDSSLLLRYMDLHCKGHIHPKMMRRAVSGEKKAWRNSGMTENDIIKPSKLGQCPTCVLAKRNKKSVHENDKTNPLDFDKSTSPLNSMNCSPGEIVSMDPSGVINPFLANGDRLFYLFKDSRTEFNHVFSAKDQSEESTKGVICRTLEWYIKQGCKPKILRVDAARTLTSVSLRAWIWKRFKVEIQTSIPYSHWQNPVERDMQTVVAGASALLHGQEWLQGDSWDLALQHFVDIRNRSPNAKCGMKSPMQFITKDTLDFNTSFQFNFGDLVAVALPGVESGKEWKFDIKNQLGIYCGNASGYKRGIWCIGRILIQFLFDFMCGASR